MNKIKQMSYLGGISSRGVRRLKGLPSTTLAVEMNARANPEVNFIMAE